MNRKIHNLGHAVQQQKNVHCTYITYNGGGYAWMDTAEAEVTAAECLRSPRMQESLLGSQEHVSEPALEAIIQLANTNHVQPTQVSSSPLNSLLTNISVSSPHQ